MTECGEMPVIERGFKNWKPSDEGVINKGKSMLSIYKYHLDIVDKQILSILKGQILCVQFQEQNLCLWVLGDPNLPTVLEVITIKGTGHPCGNDVLGDYIGTVQNSGFVWHVFGKVLKGDE
jgi:hypothetical protein